MVLVHNHPSGHPEPSRADIKVTQQLQSALVYILILVHLVVATEGGLYRLWREALWVKRSRCGSITIFARLCGLISAKHPTMKLLNTYDDKEEAETALTKISGEKRLASERDSTIVIYNLFGQPTWGNFYRLGMFDLPELQDMLERRKAGQLIDTARHKEVIAMLHYVARSFELAIPEHWM